MPEGEDTRIGRKVDERWEQAKREKGSRWEALLDPKLLLGLAAAFGLAGNGAQFVTNRGNLPADKVQGRVNEGQAEIMEAYREDNAYWRGRYFECRAAP